MIASLLMAGFFAHFDPQVTFAEPAAPLKRLMPKISEACHVAYKVHPVMENEVLCISVHDVSASDLLAKVAAATGGKWVAEKDGTFLEPDVAARRVIESRGAAKRIVRIQHFLDEFEKLQSTDAAISSTAGNVLNPQNSRVHLLQRLASVVGTKSIAAIPPGGRVVYSSSPTSGQLQLGADVSVEVTAYRKDFDQRRRARNGAEQTPEVPVSKINVIVSCSGGNLDYGNNSIGIAFVLYDSKGGVLDRDSEQLDNEFLEVGNVPASKGAEAKPEEPLRLSPEAKQFLKFITVDFQHETHGMRPAAVEKILNPDKVDPLAYPGEWLSGAAEQRGLQLVASLPDDMFQWFGADSAISVPRDVFERLDKDVTLVSQQKDTWLTISPADFSFEPISRTDLKRLAETYNAKLDISLADLMQLATAGVGSAHGLLVQIWIGDICPMMVDLIDREDWDMLRVCAATSEPILQKLLGGNPSTLIELGGSAQSLANALIFGVGPNTYDSDMGFLKVEPTQDKASTFISFEPETPEDYRAEPTEVSPNGLPPSAPILVKTESDTVIRPAGQCSYSGEQQAEMSGDTADELGQEAAVVNRDYDHQPSRIISIDYDHELSVFKSVQVGKRVTYHFRIYASTEAFKECKIVVPTFASKETYTLQTLPGELQTQFDEAVKEAKLNAQRQQDREAKNQKAPP